MTQVLLLSIIVLSITSHSLQHVLFTVGGIVLFAYEDTLGSAGWLGVLLSLGSALGAALHTPIG